MTFASAAIVVFPCFLLASPGLASCCRLVKVDDEVATVDVRACSTLSAGQCASPVFTGTLGIGDHADVCVTGETVFYSEFDSELGSYAAPVEAVCADDDVEL